MILYILFEKDEILYTKSITGRSETRGRSPVRVNEGLILGQLWAIEGLIRGRLGVNCGSLRGKLGVN